MTDPDQRRGAVAAGGAGGPAGTRRRRPWWAWLLLALLAILVILAILLLSRCGSGSEGPPPGPAGGTAAPAAPGAPGGAPAPGVAPPAAPGAPEAPGAPGAATGSSGTGGTGDVAAVSRRVQELVEASPVTFRPDSPELTASGAETVDEVARELAGAPSARVSVTGYVAPVARGIGPDAQGLSDQRAAAVAQRLESQGVDPGRIQTRGAADTDPLSSTAASRRVEIAVS
jgi:outer membrane protein OmpA-like peptidoglycan-associated protein